MKKITRISRVDVKRGASCRTDSTISLFIEKSDLSGILAYMDDFEAGNDPTGKVKKIELVIYEDQDELETIESLRAENKEMREFIDNLDKPIAEAIKSSEALINGVVIEEETEIIKDGVLGGVEIEKENLPPNQGDLKLYENDKKEDASIGDEKVIIGNYCKCETPAFVNGKCANCGGVE